MTLFSLAQWHTTSDASDHICLSSLTYWQSRCSASREQEVRCHATEILLFCAVYQDNINQDISTTGQLSCSAEHLKN